MSRPVRLAVLDDGLFVRTGAGAIRPLSATFHRYVEAVARSGAFGRVRYIVPVRHLHPREAVPPLDAVDESVLEVVPTAFFRGIADYLLRAGWLAAHNWPIIDGAIGDSDLLWLRLPASNALLALTAARRRGVPHFGWLAGSVRAVARAQTRAGPARWLAETVGSGYDAVSSLAGRHGPLWTLDADLFASAVTAAEVAQTASRPVTRRDGPWRVVWAGRMAREKRLSDLVEAVRRVRLSGHDVSLVLIGDGPARPALERALAGLPRDRVEDHGYVGERASYMNLLRGGDVLVHPSGAEGVPKVLVEAMAAGLPVVAADAGAVRELLDTGARGKLVPAGDVARLADVIAGLLDNEPERAVLREQGLAWAAEHTAEAQAGRLIGRLRDEFPQLDWPS
jgi:glycosyltransferase involved in cell wall biosynthesis